MRNHYIARQTIGLLLLLVVASVSASHNSAASQLLTRNHRGVAQSFLTPAPVGRTRDATKIDLRATRLIPSKTANQLNVRGGASVVASISDYIGASKFRCWMAITVAIFTDIGATTLLNIATKEKSSPKLAGALSIYLVSLLFFGSSLQKLDVSIAYAVWSALGTAFVSAVGIAFFGEQFDAVKVSCIFCIIAGVIGLNLRDAAV